ncbi:MAG TPA: SDR family NAD(P)-dependent oxidoreductase [Acidimicrobiales bacterium]|nr:SDR family NAD(P)-dependent oxidoreductase [Acidimicrobiales bacterium]
MTIEAGDVAVVTGAASGIGLGLAQRLVDRGVAVVMSDIEAPALAAAVATMADVDVGVIGVECDVSRRDDVFALAQRAIDEFGQVNAVFNNAGIFSGLGPMWELDHTVWEWNMRVNLWGVIHGIEAFVPPLVARNRGHVVNTASLAGVATPPFNAPYNAAKHAVVALSETLRAELDVFAPGVGVSVVCPGAVATRVQESARNRPDDLVPSDGSGGTVLLTDAGLSDRDQKIVAAAMSSGDEGPPEVFAPYDFAGEVLAGVDAGTLHIAPGRSTAQAARRRVDALLADLQEQGGRLSG